MIAELLNRPPGPYHGAAFTALDPVRLAGNMEPRVIVVPENYYAGAGMPSGSTVEYRATVPAGSVVWAISGYGGAGFNPNFQLQIFDQAAKKNLFSQPMTIRRREFSGYSFFNDSYFHLGPPSSTRSFAYYPQVLLPKPYPVRSPGVLHIQITSNGPAFQQQACIWVAIPTGEGAVNEHDITLAADLVAASRAVRTPQSSDPVMVALPIDITTLGDNIVIFGAGSSRITIYELDLWNVSSQTIKLLDGANALRGPYTNLPDTTGVYLGHTGRPHFQLSPGQPFIINLSAGTQVTGYVRYRLE
jgi:hypothetical protein